METHASPLAGSQPSRPANAVDADAPYLARCPWAGYLLFGIFSIVYLLIAWQVVTRGPIVAWDVAAEERIYNWAQRQPEPLVLFMRFLSAYGRDGVALIGLVLLFFWARRGVRRELQLLVFGFMAGELWFQLQSRLFNRARPEFKDPFEILIGPGFPSGHATTNLLLGGLILYLLLPRIASARKRALLSAAVIGTVLLIGFSRLFLGLHYPTDILAGYVFALAWGALIFTLVDRAFWKRMGR